MAQRPRDWTEQKPGFGDNYTRLPPAPYQCLDFAVSEGKAQVCFYPFIDGARDDRNPRTYACSPQSLRIVLQNICAVLNPAVKTVRIRPAENAESREAYARSLANCKGILRASTIEDRAILFARDDTRDAES